MNETKAEQTIHVLHSKIAELEAENAGLLRARDILIKDCDEWRSKFTQLEADFRASHETGMENLNLKHHHYGELQIAKDRIAELEAANANCISLLLHESRMSELETENAKLKELVAECVDSYYKGNPRNLDDWLKRAREVIGHE